MIHIIGDSHALTFDGAKDVKCYHLGAVTAFRLWKKNNIIQNILKDIPKEDKVFFCVGEIDIRIHIYKSFKETNIMPIGFYTDITWYNYVRYIYSLKSSHDVSIMNVPPVGYQDNFFGYEYYADRRLRNQFAVGSYCTLLDFCNEYKIPFVDIWYDDFEELCEKDIELWPEEYFQDDACHVKREIAIDRLEKWCQKNLK